MSKHPAPLLQLKAKILLAKNLKVIKNTINTKTNNKNVLALTAKRMAMKLFSLLPITTILVTIIYKYRIKNIA